jgi:hypothetical protein
MIKVYLDESGIHQGAAVCTVAGYAAPWRAWKKIFVKEWPRVLKRFGLSDFHAKRFFKRAGDEYAGWTEGETIDCFNQLVAVINQAHLTPVGAAVVTQSFWKLSQEERRWITGAEFDVDTSKWLDSGAPKTPYHLPVRHAVIESAKFGSPDNKVHYVHDRQDQYAPLVLEGFNQLKETLRSRDNLGDMVFSGRREAIPLQAADLIAYHVAKYAESRLQTGEPHPTPSYEMQRLMERPNEIRYYDDYGLSLLLSGCPQAIRTTQSLLTSEEDESIKAELRAKYGYKL